MNREVLNRFKGALTRRRALLLNWVAGHDGGVARTCDHEIIESVDETIHRIDDGRFGTCEVCGGRVESERLALDYTASVCLECLSAMDRRTLERELEMAAEVQRSLLPRHVPILAGAEIAVHAQPARIVGGDYFDFFASPDGVQSVAIADVMGKGLPASMLMSSLQASLRILGPEHDDLPQLAGRLNALFRFNLRLIRFISLILARIDVERREVGYLNAGHNPALLWKSSERAGHWLQPTGPAIGLVKEPVYACEKIGLDSGDLLVMYTDGLVEARNRSGEEFGTTRLLEFTAEHHSLGADRFVSGLRDEVLRFAHSKPHDDLTLMVIRSNGVAA